MKLSQVSNFCKLQKSQKQFDEVTLQLFQIYGAVKILPVVASGLLRRFCALSYRLSDSWIPFAEILVNFNTFGT